MSNSANAKGLNPNPSTYKQVIENMQSIIQLFDKMGNLDNLPMSVEEMGKIVDQLKDAILTPSEEGGSVVTTPEGTKVIGVHSNTENAEVNTLPGEYNQGMTLELKNAATIGLAGKDGVKLPFIFVLTFIQDSSLDTESALPETSYAPMQLAFADASAIMYSRTGSMSANTWGEWQAPDTGDEYVNQIIESETEPANQPAGHYWVEPIE